MGGNMHKFTVPMFPAPLDSGIRGWSLDGLRHFMEEDGGAGGGATGAQGAAGAQGATGDPGESGGNALDDEGYPAFPANTPVAEMKPKEQAAYWRHQSRKHESRVKDRADYDALKAKAEQFDQLSEASKTENERALNTAKTEAAKEAEAKAKADSAPKLVDAEMRAAAALKGITPEQLAPLIEPLDRTKFLTDTGDVDLEKVTTYVAGIQPTAEGNGSNNGTKAPNLGQGRRSTGDTPTSVASGAARYAERHPKKGTGAPAPS